MCKSHVLWFPGAEQKLEDWHNKSKVANLWASCFGLSDFLYFELNIELVLGDQVAKYQKLSKQLSWGMGYLFLLLEEEGLTTMCCLSWLFKRVGFLSGYDYSLRQTDFTGKPIQNLLNHFELAGKGLKMTHWNWNAVSGAWHQLPVQCLGVDANQGVPAALSVCFPCPQ